VSKGNYMDSLREMIVGFKLGDHVIFVGPLADSILSEKFRRGSVLVAPSRFESFGMVLLEGMASGIPTVASDLPVFREVGGSAAVLVEPTPEEIANAVVKLFFDEKLRDLLASRGKQIAQQFTWQKINKQIMRVYDECICGRSK